jgi:hypothetical protein
MNTNFEETSIMAKKQFLNDQEFPQGTKLFKGYCNQKSDIAESLNTPCFFTKRRQRYSFQNL